MFVAREAPANMKHRGKDHKTFKQTCLRITFFQVLVSVCTIIHLCWANFFMGELGSVPQSLGHQKHKWKSIARTGYGKQTLNACKIQLVSLLLKRNAPPKPKTC